jgi:hypothetical protein
MSDEQLGRMDPVEVNLIVARGIPGLESLDIPKYRRQVDEWARVIKARLDAGESHERDSPAYRHDPDLWRAGAMAIALAGPLANIKYTTERLDLRKPEQSFIHGVIDLRRGTCASMPALYMGFAHRLGWPLKAVVSGDHMWTRWDDGAKRFNLEATDATSEDGMGSFSSLTDEELAGVLGTPLDRIASGSDFTSLTPRQTLAVYLQSRAGYFASQFDFPAAHRDLMVAKGLFPRNADISAFLSRVHSRLEGGVAPRPPRKTPHALPSDDDLAARNAAFFSPPRDLERSPTP